MVATSGRTSSVSRSAVRTKKGVVASSSPLAGAIGAQILRRGGNACDAAVAVAVAEAVTLPPMCGMGGEVFALIYNAKDKSIRGVSGGGRAPMGATREYFIERGYEKMPTDGPLCPSVPGEVAAWETILEQFGTMSLAEVIEPAIELAEEGFAIPGRLAKYFTQAYDKLAKFEESWRVRTMDLRKALAPQQ